MREERHTQLEARQEQVETRLRQVLDYCRKVAADSANRQNVIDELRSRVAELENEQVVMVICHQFLEGSIFVLAGFQLAVIKTSSFLLKITQPAAAAGKLCYVQGIASGLGPEIEVF